MHKRCESGGGKEEAHTWLRDMRRRAEQLLPCCIHVLILQCPALLSHAPRATSHNSGPTCSLKWHMANSRELATTAACTDMYRARDASRKPRKMACSGTARGQGWEESCNERAQQCYVLACGVISVDARVLDPGNNCATLPTCSQTGAQTGTGANPSPTSSQTGAQIDTRQK